MENQATEKHSKSSKIIRNVYLYLVSMIGLLTLIFGMVGIINNVLTNYVFQVDDNSYYTPYSAGPCDVSMVDTKDPTGKTMVQRSTQEIADCQKKVDAQNEKTRKNNAEREFSIAIAQILVGGPIWWYHWTMVQKDNKHKEEV